VELMTLVSLGLRPSLHAAARTMETLPVSLAALYDKVNRTEPAILRALGVWSQGGGSTMPSLDGVHDASVAQRSSAEPRRHVAAVERGVAGRHD